MGALLFRDDSFVQRMNSTLRSLLPKAAVSKSLKLIRLSAKSMDGRKDRDPNSNVCEEPTPGMQAALIWEPEHLHSGYSTSIHDSSDQEETKEQRMEQELKALLCTFHEGQPWAIYIFTQVTFAKYLSPSCLSPRDRAGLLVSGRKKHTMRDIKKRGNSRMIGSRVRLEHLMFFSNTSVE